MPLRITLPITLVAMLLLVAVAVVWRPARPDAVAEPRELDYIPPRGYVCCRAAGPIAIDGQVDDAGWKNIPWSEDFVDIEGDAKPRPPLRTRVKMAWDDQYLYIAAELEEPHVRATLTRHDSYIFHEDHDFEVFIDPDGDSHLYAELEMNAFNTTWDLLLPRPYHNGARAIDDWEIRGLKSAVHVDGTINDARDSDRGWTIEIAWPWSNLNQLALGSAPPKPGNQWRVNFSRVELDFEVAGQGYRRIPGRKEHNWVWSPQGVVNMHRPERWGYVQFSAGPPGKDAFRPDPTGPARELLQRVYFNQQEYRRLHGRYAGSMRDLGLDGLTHASLASQPRLETTENWFEASVPVKDGPRIRIEADSRVTVDR